MWQPWHVCPLPKFALVFAQEKLNDTAAEAERVAADLVHFKQENAERVSAADVEAAKAEARDLASRLQVAEEQVSEAHDVPRNLCEIDIFGVKG